MPRLRIPLPRLPLHHLHRAFPELDAYTDEQCLRFIHAARGPVSIRFLRGSAIALAALIASAASLSGFIYLHTSVLGDSRTLGPGSPLLTWYGLLLNIVLILIGCATPPIGAFLARDFLLIRRVRRILRTRGTCPSCRYSLVGLAVAPDLKVTCPECGNITTVDPSLGELTTDEAGRPRFKPDESRHKKSHFWTDARRKRFKRAAPWLAASIIGLPLLIAGSNEAFIRWQASVARKERPPHDALIALIEANRLPGETPGQPDAWAIIDRAAEQMHALDRQIWEGAGTKWNPGNERHYPDYNATMYPQASAVIDPDHDDYQRADRLARAAFDEQCRLLALEMLELHRKDGLYDTLREAADTRFFTRNLWADEYTTFEENTPYVLGPRRILASICAARMKLAHEALDKAEFLDATRSGLALAALHLRQPVLIDHLHGLAFEGLICARLNDALVRGVPPDWLPEIDDLLANHETHASHTLWIESERITALDAVAFTFSHPDFVRLGRWTPALAEFRDHGERLGTYAANRNEILAWHANHVAMRALPVQQKVAAARPESDLMLLGASLLPTRKSVTTEDRATLTRRSLRTIIAIERYRAAHGAPPDSLAALVPNFLTEVPLDPWVGKPLGYKLIDPTADSLNRPYLLYCVGGDFTDNDGAINPTQENKNIILIPGRAEGAGLDFILNRNDW